MDASSQARPAKTAITRVEATPKGVVVPGTPLAEAGFRAALGASGARWIVVEVFAADCGPCMTEALELAARRPAWRRTGVDVLGIGMDRTTAEVERFFRATGERIDFPLYQAAWFAEKHQIEITPTLLIYTADGQLLFRTDAARGEGSALAAVEARLAQLTGQDPS